MPPKNFYHHNGIIQNRPGDVEQGPYNHNIRLYLLLRVRVLSTKPKILVDYVYFSKHIIKRDIHNIPTSRLRDITDKNRYTVHHTMDQPRSLAKSVLELGLSEGGIF